MAGLVERRRRGHRHRLQPRPRPPLARLAGRRRLHRGRRPRLARRAARRPGRRAPRRCSAPTPTRRRRSPSRRARCAPGRRRTASRSPTAPRTARRWPSTATRRRRGASRDRADPIGEQLVLDVAEPIDHLTLEQAPGAAAVRHIGARQRHRRRPGAADASTSTTRSFSLAGQRVDIEPTTGPSTVTITIDGVVVPDPTIGPALAAVGFAEVGTGLGPTVEVVRPPADAAAAIAAAGPDVPVSFVLTRLRTRPTDRWRVRSRAVDRPRRRAARRPRRSTLGLTVRLDQRAADDILAALLGITGPLATTPPHRRRRRPPAGRRPTTIRRRRGSRRSASAVGAELDRDDRRAADVVHADPAGWRLLPDHRRCASTAAASPSTPPWRRRTPTGTSTVDAARRRSRPAPCGSRVTGIEPRSTLDRRYAEPVTLPAAISEISAGARTVVPATFDTGCRDDLLTIDGGRGRRAACSGSVADAAGRRPARRRRCATARRSTSPPVPTASRPRRARGPASTSTASCSPHRTGPATRRRRRPDGHGARRRAARAATSRSTAVPTAAGSCSARASTTRGRRRRPTATSVRRSSSTAASTAGGSRPPPSPVDVAIRWTGQRPLTHRPRPDRARRAGLHRARRARPSARPPALRTRAGAVRVAEPPVPRAAALGRRRGVGGRGGAARRSGVGAGRRRRRRSCSSATSGGRAWPASSRSASSSRSAP